MLRVSTNAPVIKPMSLGVVTLGPAASYTVFNDKITDKTSIMLTIQDGGTIPKGSVYVLTRVPGTSFTIKSTVNTDTGIKVFWQIIEPTI